MDYISLEESQAINAYINAKKTAHLGRFHNWTSYYQDQ